MYTEIDLIKQAGVINSMLGGINGLGRRLAARGLNASNLKPLGNKILTAAFDHPAITTAAVGGALLTPSLMFAGDKVPVKKVEPVVKPKPTGLNPIERARNLTHKVINKTKTVANTPVTVNGKNYKPAVRYYEEMR